jgi:hypothetical protein
VLNAQTEAVELAATATATAGSPRHQALKYRTPLATHLATVVATAVATNSNTASVWVYKTSFWPTQVGKLCKAINKKQKQIASVCNNVTQIFKYIIKFVKNKANNHGRYFYLFKVGRTY